MSKLIRGNELELAVSVGTVLGNVPAQLRVATELLSRRCEFLGKWSVHHFCEVLWFYLLILFFANCSLRTLTLFFQLITQRVI